jgi:hypothetical protein
MISVLVGDLVLMSSSWTAGGIFGRTGGGGLLIVFLKCSVHLTLWSFSLLMVSPFLSLTALVGLLFLSECPRYFVVFSCFVGPLLFLLPL